MDVIYGLHVLGTFLSDLYAVYVVYITCFSGTWRITQAFSAQTNNCESNNSSENEEVDESLEAMSVASRDRTNEFHAVLKSMKTRQVVLYRKS